MRRFLYLADPLFLISAALYLLNRCVLKPHLHSPLLQCWFDDLLMIPCALPPLLLLYRCVGLRRHDAPPSGQEILSLWLFWSILLEWAGPQLMPGVTGDPLDALAYGVGALVSFLIWSLRAHSGAGP